MSLIINLEGYRYEELKLLNSINHTLHLYNLPEYKRPHKPNLNGELLPSLVWRTSNFTHLQYIYVKLKEGLCLELDGSSGFEGISKTNEKGRLII
jgi:hypothetical protein